jgi:ADP-ribose pyrophosphatase
MKLERWKKLRLVNEIKNPWWTYRTEEFRLPSGTIGQYHFVHTNGSSLTIPVQDDGRIVLVRQYRYLCDRNSLEFPCGSVKDGSTYKATARTELAEEANFAAAHLEEIGMFNPYNGVTDEICKVYLATRLSPAHSIPDETEQFEKVFLKPSEIEQKIGTGEIWDGMTLAAWVLAQKKIAR